MLKLVAMTAAYAATIPAANWMIGNVGTECVAQGPCTIPVGFGLMAPSGVLMVGLALVLRDAVQEIGGPMVSLMAVAIGGAISWLVAPPALVAASVAAFTLSELVDFLIYTPLRRRQLATAVIAGSLAGSIIDSAVFLYIAFGSLAFIEGQILGKLWMSFAAIPLVYLARRARA